MLHHLVALTIPAALLCLLSAPVQAQWPAPPYQERYWSTESLAGTYVNVNNRGTCYVYARGRGYVFVNEHGTPAEFVHVSPRKLRMVSGEWNPNVIVTVTRDPYGRRVLRFDTAFEPTGYWVEAT